MTCQSLLSWKTFCMKCQSLFSGKNINLSSAEFAQRVLKVMLIIIAKRYKKIVYNIVLLRNSMKI